MDTSERTIMISVPNLTLQGRLVQTHLLAYLNLLPAHFGQLLVLGSVPLLQYLATCPVHAGILSGGCSTALMLSKGMVERTVLPRI